MKRQPALYTFKVWLWSAVLSPFIAAILQFYGNEGTVSDLSWLSAYVLILFSELLLTSFLWILFWALTAICSNLLKEDQLLRCAASAVGLTIAASVCWITADEKYSLNNMFFDIALANSLCIF